MSEWKEVKLGDVADIVMGQSPSSKFYNFKGDGIPFLQGNRTFGRLYPRIDTYTSFSKKIAKKGSILFSVRAPVGDINIAHIEICIGRGLSSLKAKNGNNVFLFYLLKYYKNKLLNFENGSVFGSINKTDLENLDISLPLPEQQAIAEVLSSLDDKIDLLHRQNKTLEQMAETLFRQWFIEEAQADWEERKITDLFEIRDGTHDSPKQKPIGKKLITSKHIKNHKLDFESAYLISEEDFNKVNQRSEVNQFDILFSMIGTIGLVYLEQNNIINYAIKNVGLFKTSQNQEWAYYMYLWLQSDLGKIFIFENKSGSTQQYISLTSLRNIKLNLPLKFDIRLFANEVKYYFEKIRHNQSQIQTLEKLRDTLLPKLMSGEVTIASCLSDTHSGGII